MWYPIGMIDVLKGRFTQSHSVRKQLSPLNLIYLNDITVHDWRYELMKLKMEWANSTLPKSQFSFRSHEKSQIPIPIAPILVQFQFNSELN